ncbi:MAG TPA: hypothetical protein VIJ28_20360 [Chloroflexota bacterium]|jgi:hypothetical protein
MQDVRLGAGTPVGAGATESSPPTAGAIQGGVVAANANDQDSASGFSLVDASASLAGRNSVVTDVVLGANNQISGIRVIDSVTHEVIAESPPDSIARMREEVLAYQDVVRGNKIS